MPRRSPLTVQRRTTALFGGLLLLAAQRPASPPTELGEHRLVPGITIELAAAEPLLYDPVDLEFDALGRAFVLEMGGYPETEEDDRRGRIVQLLDRNRDGRYDGRRVFAEGFRYADSILPYWGGFLVADAPDVLFVKDTDGDQRADLRQVLIEGFALGPSESNVNGLAYGPDGWVYAANGSSGGSVFLSDSPDEKISIRGLDVRFRFGSGADGSLTDGRLETAGPMGGGFGVTFDDAGRRFVTHEQRHIQAEIAPRRLLPASGGWPKTVVEIVDYGGGSQTRVFPISEVAERPNHPEQAGYFTAASGLTHYGGEAAPSLRGQFFAGATVHNLVHRDLVVADGAGFRAERIDEGFEFFAAEDPAFRPVNFANGPDGALYIVDMQRDTIEHPEWIPDDMEAELDLRAGADRGRIYRLYEGPRPLPAVIRSLGTYDTYALVDALELDNQWHRSTARRLLAEQGEPGAVPLLRERLTDPLARTRLEALFALESMEELDAVRNEEVARLLADDSPDMRERSLLAFGDRLLQPDLVEAALRTAADPKPRVRLFALLQLRRAALAVTPSDGSRAARRAADDLLSRVDGALVAGAQGGASEEWLRIAAAAAAAERHGSWIGALESWPTPSSGQMEAHVTLWRTLGRAWGQHGSKEAIDAALLLKRARADLRLAVADGLGLGLAQRSTTAQRPVLSSRARRKVLQLATHEQTSIATIGQRIARELGLAVPGSADRARAAVQRIVGSDVPPESRLEELELLELLDLKTLNDALPKLLAPELPASLAAQALRALTTSEEPPQGLAVALIGRWPTLRPAERQLAVDFLLYRRENHELLLGALENGSIQLGEMRLDLERRRTLLRWSTPAVGERAARLFADSGVKTRSEALATFRPALDLEGDLRAGEAVFEELCARCHALRGNSSGSVGPDLTDSSHKSAAGLLRDIVDPNANASPEYLTFDVETSSGDLFSGLLSEDGDTYEIRLATGERRRVRRNEVRELRASGLSMMPEELEAGMDPQQMADLLAFLRQPR
ncbi:MAG: PVC-type heme-binding CxxCH protein [Acidobacteriota bacterium]